MPIATAGRRRRLPRIKVVCSRVGFDGGMRSYAIHLHGADGLVREERTVHLPHDDAAIDYAGWIDHPHAISVWRGDHLVAYFPPGPREGAD